MRVVRLFMLAIVTKAAMCCRGPLVKAKEGDCLVNADAESLEWIATGVLYA